MFKTLFTVLFGFAIVSTTEAADSVSVPLKIDGSGAIVVAVTINGQGPFAFLLDTGSNRSAVSSDLASRLSLAAVARTLTVTSTGTQAQQVVKLDRIAVGSVERIGLLASVVPVTQLKTAAPGVDGVVGQDFLSASDYTLDYRRKRLTWTAVGPQADSQDVRLILVKREGRFLVELLQDGKAVRFVPDSGAAGFVIFERGDRVPVSIEEMGAGVELVSLTGSREARPVTLRQLRVGGVTLRNQRAVVIQRNEPDAPEGDGLLPLHLFASVSFNCQEGYLVARSR